MRFGRAAARKEKKLIHANQHVREETVDVINFCLEVFLKKNKNKNKHWRGHNDASDKLELMDVFGSEPSESLWFH